MLVCIDIVIHVVVSNVRMHLANVFVSRELHSCHGNTRNLNKNGFQVVKRVLNR